MRTCSHCLGYLHGRQPTAPTSPQDQDPPSLLQTPSVSEGLQGRQVSARHRSRFGEAQGSGLQAEAFGLRDRVVGEAAGATAKDLVADLELRDLVSDLLDDAGNIEADDRAEEATGLVVHWVDGPRLDLEQDLGGATGGGLVGGVEAHATCPASDNSSHGGGWAGCVSHGGLSNSGKKLNIKEEFT